MKTEQDRVEKISSWYLKDQLDFDKRLVRFRYLTLRGHVKGPGGLELGPADGVMTHLLLPHFESLTIVEGSETLLASIPPAPNLTKVHALFEAYEPRQQFNTVIAEHILEHVEDPVALLRKTKGWLARGGKLVLGVPNANSIHRLVAVKMGLLRHPCELNQRDHILGHRRVYTRQTLTDDLKAAGLRIVEMGGVFFKPLSNQQIQDHWTDEMIQGFYELGKDFAEHAAELYAVCDLA